MNGLFIETTYVTRQHCCDDSRRQCARCKAWYCDECKAFEHPHCPMAHEMNVPRSFPDPSHIITRREY